MKTLQGIAAVGGIAIGPLVIYRRTNARGGSAFAPDQPPAARLAAALTQADSELAAIADKVRAEVGGEQAAIFEAQRLMVQDPSLMQTTSQLIAAGNSPESAVQQAGEQYAAMLEGLDDPYMRERAADVRDVTGRVERILRGISNTSPQLSQPAILFATDLTPSETATLAPQLVRGIGLAQGGLTSHVVIVARSKNIPTVVGLGELEAADGQNAVLDGDTGKLLLEPNPPALAAYQAKQQAALATQQQQLALRDQPAISRDGVPVRLVANIGALDEAKGIAAYGAEGVGLLRTEFLFLEHEPSEDEQLAVYRQIFAAVRGEIVARTMDLGGDKPPPYLDFGDEANPFLGWRGLRIGLERPAMLHTQLRALLRAAVGRKFCIMFPMVSTVEELRAARAMVAEAQQAVGAEQPRELQVGIMVEVPAAAMMADALAAEVDFFSIGSNDLTQYVMAADRGNRHVANLYSAAQPAVLRTIARVAESAHAAGKWVGICGEAGGDPQLAPLWLGLGIDELSMGAARIPAVKQVILSRDASACRALAQQALACATLDEVLKLIPIMLGGDVNWPGRAQPAPTSIHHLLDELV